jgi:hypothetical protein
MKTKKKLKLWKIKKLLPGKIQNHISKSIQNCSHRCAQTLAYSSKRVLCELKWASKIPAVPDSYKKYTSWLELETCYADLKFFAITPRLLRTN